MEVGFQIVARLRLLCNRLCRNEPQQFPVGTQVPGQFQANMRWDSFFFRRLREVLATYRDALNARNPT
jgi:hypothetical protein